MMMMMMTTTRMMRLKAIDAIIVAQSLVRFASCQFSCFNDINLFIYAYSDFMVMVAGFSVA